VAKRPLRAADLFEILAQLDEGTGLRDRARGEVQGSIDPIRD
jgi:hypothetical protein